MSLPIPTARKNHTPGGFPHIVTQVLMALTFIVGIISAIGLKATHAPVTAITGVDKSGNNVTAQFTAHYASFFGKLPDIGAMWTVVLLLIALVVTIIVTPKHFIIGFLTSLLPLLIVWRVAAMAGSTGAYIVPKSSNFINGWANGFGPGKWAIYLDRPWAVMILCALTFMCFLVEFAMAWRHDVHFRTNNKWLIHLVWGATLIRIYMAFNEVGHTTEKIFASTASFHAKGQGNLFMGNASWPVFNALGKAPYFFAGMAGVIELLIAIGVGFGFMTRLAAGGAVVYFLLATVPYGGEWGHGYAGFADGWELPALLVAIFAAFIVTGPGPFSIDYQLARSGKMPKWMRPLSLPKFVDVNDDLSPIL